MTDEERRKLLSRLRRTWWQDTKDVQEAADEIERLATELEKYKKLYSETEEAGWEGIARSVPFDRDTGGWVVREAWIRWAQTQPNPKPSWLVPYAELAEPDKEADRQIAEAVARWIGAVRTQSDAEPSLSDQMYGFHGAGFNSTTSDTEPVAQKKLEEATTYAEQLAISLAARWYPEVLQWRPLRNDLIGLLTQIDNMSTGAVRVQSDTQKLALKLRAAHPGYPPGELCVKAADEIERLATELEKYKKLYSETEEAGWEGMPE